MWKGLSKRVREYWVFERFWFWFVFFFSGKAWGFKATAFLQGRGLAQEECLRAPVWSRELLSVIIACSDHESCLGPGGSQGAFHRSNQWGMERMSKSTASHEITSFEGTQGGVAKSCSLGWEFPQVLQDLTLFSAGKKGQVWLVCFCLLSAHPCLSQSDTKAFPVSLIPRNYNFMAVGVTEEYFRA